MKTTEVKLKKCYDVVLVVEYTYDYDQGGFNQQYGDSDPESEEIYIHSIKSDCNIIEMIDSYHKSSDVINEIEESISRDERNL